MCGQRPACPLAAIPNPGVSEKPVLVDAAEQQELLPQGAVSHLGIASDYWLLFGLQQFPVRAGPGPRLVRDPPAHGKAAEQNKPAAALIERHACTTTVGRRVLRGDHVPMPSTPGVCRISIATNTKQD